MILENPHVMDKMGVDISLSVLGNLLFATLFTALSTSFVSRKQAHS